MSGVTLTREGLVGRASVILLAFQEAHMRRKVQVRLVRKEPLGSGDPCPKCNCLGNGCEGPCEKVLSFMEANPNLGDEFY